MFLPWLQSIRSSTIPLPSNRWSNDTESKTQWPTPQKSSKSCCANSKNWITSKSSHSLWKDQVDSNFSIHCSTSDSLIERKQHRISLDSTPKEHIVGGDGEKPKTKTQHPSQRRNNGPLKGLFGVDKIWRVEELPYFFWILWGSNGLWLWMKEKEYGFLELGFGWRENKTFRTKSHYIFCYFLVNFLKEINACGLSSWTVTCTWVMSSA